MMENMENNYDNFEVAFDELKNIVKKFENNEITIEELINNYEQGMKAYSYCMKKLEDTQKKIKFIETNYE
ncbi:MAG: Exonuclease small subunit [Bacillota bacterium]|jgi:exodeoxyribonuclease VII small subunit|nr:Exonuclease small subunit [Bacillota bacterium]